MVEDATDGRALTAIIANLVPEGLQVIDTVPARGRGEVARRASDLIDLAGRRADCVLVVVDQDGDNADSHPHFKRIRAACAESSTPARLVLISQQIEAWFLADDTAVLRRAGAHSGFTASGTTDGESDAKRRLSTILRRLRNRSYSPATDAARLAQDLDPEKAAAGNLSFKRFAKLVRGCVSGEAA